MAQQTIQKGYGGKARFTVLPSAARTATPTIDDFTVPYGKTLTLIINITAGAATPAVTPAIVGKTADLGITYTVLTGAQITSTSAAKVIMRVGAGCPETANLSTGIPLPAVFSVTMTHGDSDSLTYSIEAEVV